MLLTIGVFLADYLSPPPDPMKTSMPRLSLSSKIVLIYQFMLALSLAICCVLALKGRVIAKRIIPYLVLPFALAALHELRCLIQMFEDAPWPEYHLYQFLVLLIWAILGFVLMHKTTSDTNVSNAT